MRPAFFDLPLTRPNTTLEREVLMSDIFEPDRRVPSFWDADWRSMRDGETFEAAVEIGLEWYESVSEDLCTTPILERMDYFFRELPAVGAKLSEDRYGLPVSVSF